MFVNVGPVDFITVGPQFVPLHAGMQDMQHIIEDFVVRQLWFSTPLTFGKIRQNIAVKVLLQHLRWQLVVAGFPRF